ncbi:Palmitoyltransferase PFA3 [Dirofilaria immitis]
MITSVIYEGPAGHQAVQSLPTKHFELLQKFVKKNDPEEMEDLLWIQDNTASKTTILNMKNFRKNMKTFPSAKYINWQDTCLNEINVHQHVAPNTPISYSTRITRCICRNKRFFLFFLCVIILLSLIVVVIFCITLSSSFNSGYTSDHYSMPTTY